MIGLNGQVRRYSDQFQFHIYVAARGPVDPLNEGRLAVARFAVVAHVVAHVVAGKSVHQTKNGEKNPAADEERENDQKYRQEHGP